MATDEINRSGTPSTNSGDGVLVRHWGDGSAGLVRGARLQGYYPSGPDWRDVQVDADGKLVVSGAGGGGSDTELETPVLLTDAMANPTLSRVGSMGMVWNGATWDRASQALTNTQLRASPVPVSGTVSVTEPVSVDDNGGSLTVDGTVEIGAASLAALESITVVDGGGSLTVDGTVAVSGSVDTELPAAAALADNVANPTVPGVGGFGMVWDGATWDRLTQPLTDTQLRASAVPVSNTVLSVVGGGVEATAQRVTIASDSTGVLSVDDNGSTLSVDDGAGSLTVDNAALSVVGGGTEATAQRVTIASDSTGVLSVDDNGSTLSVDDGAGSLTVDNAVLSVVGGGTEATAQRVTIASDSTGVLSVDDNGGSLTVDGTVVANPSVNQGRTVTAFVLDQAGAGTTQIATASPGNKRKIIGIIASMSADGTVRFRRNSGGTNLSGDMDVAQRGGFVIPPGEMVLWESGVNEDIDVITTGGALNGTVWYITEA
jgi:hypothetical protein